MSAMDSLSDALNERMSRHGLDQVLAATAIVASANRILPSPFRATTFKEGVLTIVAPDGASSYGLKAELDTYHERINAALPRPVVAKLRVRLAHS